MKQSGQSRSSDRTHPSETAIATDAITRRMFIEGSAALLAAVAVSAIAARDARAGKKTSKKLARYQTTPKGNRKCANCTFFEPAKKSCKVVEGEISPEGWCVRFVKKKA